MEKRIGELEKEVKDINLEIKAMTTGLNEYVNEFQNALVNLSVSISAITNTLTKNKIVTEEQLREQAEIISKELTDEYKKWVDTNINKGKSPDASGLIK